MKTVFLKPAAVERKWLVIDAQDQILGRVAAKVASLLRGKEKAVFAPHQEVGDFVVVVNADTIRLTGRKAEQKQYYRHSGYAGGLKTVNFEQLVHRHPRAPLEKAIQGMLPKGPLGRKLLKNVKVYAGGEHPHGAQHPEAIQV
jgi:large subunit ribosomal protein L13